MKKFHPFIALGVTSLVSIGLLVACSKEKQGPQERSFPVLVAVATQANVPVFVEAIGTVNSPQTVQIRPQVGGLIQEAYIAQGQYVRAGDPLYQIDPRPFQAALDHAQGTLLKDEAALEYAKITVARYKELAKKDYISQLNYEEYQANVQAAEGQVLSDKADIEVAQLNLEWSKPTSPVTGRISQNVVEVGNLVIANDPAFITDVRQMDPIQVWFSIPQRDFVKVQDASRSGTLKFLAFLPQRPETPREGQIFFVDNHIDQTTGTILLKGQAPNEDEFLWPGEFVQVKLQLRVQKDAVVVPEEALQVGQDGPFVYVYQPETSRVEYRKVKKGARYDHHMVVEEGVHPGEHVVTKGTVNLRPGAKVYIPQAADGQVAWEGL